MANDSIVIQNVPYKLRSVILHSGEDACSGHYVCDSYHPHSFGQWWHYNDDKLRSAQKQDFVPHLAARDDTMDQGTASWHLDIVWGTKPNRMLRALHEKYRNCLTPGVSQSHGIPHWTHDTPWNTPWDIPWGTPGTRCLGPGTCCQVPGAWYQIFP